MLLHCTCARNRIVSASLCFVPRPSQFFCFPACEVEKLGGPSLEQGYVRLYKVYNKFCFASNHRIYSCVWLYTYTSRTLWVLNTTRAVWHYCITEGHSMRPHVHVHVTCMCTILQLLHNATPKCTQLSKTAIAIDTYIPGLLKTIHTQMYYAISPIISLLVCY